MKITSESDDIVTFLTHHTPENYIICMCQISIEDIQFTAWNLKIHIDHVRYVRLLAKFPGD